MSVRHRRNMTAMPDRERGPVVPPDFDSAPECVEHDFVLACDQLVGWWVASGYVDVFAVGAEELEAEARVGVQGRAGRRHVLRLPPGGVVFSVTRNSGPQQLRAVCGPDTRVLRAPLNWHPELGSLVDFWIQGLAGGLGYASAPQNGPALESGASAKLGAGDIACAARDMVWLQLEGGSATYLGLAGPVLGASEPPVPVTRDTWITATTAAQVRALDTDSLIRQGGLGPALDGFHALVLTSLDEERQEAEKAALDQAQAQAKAERQAVQAALQGLASIMRKPEVADVGRAAGDDRLLAACSIVGKALGVAVKPPPHGANAHVRLAEIARASRFFTRRVMLRQLWWKADNGPLLGFRARESASPQASSGPPEQPPTADAAVPEADGRPHEEMDPEAALSEGGEPVALLPVAPGRYVLVDPRDGVRRPVNATTAAGLSPVALEFYRPFPNEAIAPWKLLKFALRDCRRDLLVTALMGLAISGLGLFMPVVTGFLINQVIPSSDRPEVFTLGLGMLIVTAATVFFQFTRGVATQRIEGIMGNSVQAAVWDRLLALPTTFFRQYSAGDLAMRSMSIDSMRQALTGASISAILGAIFSLFSVALMFYYNVGLALLALVPLLGMAVFTVGAGLTQIRLDRPMLQIQGRISGLVLQLLNGIAKIRVAGAESRVFARWGQEFTRQKQFEWRSVGVSNNLNVVDGMFPVVAAIVLFLGVTHTPRGNPARMTPGDFLAFYAAFGQCAAALLALSSALTSAVMAVPLFERARPILEALPEVNESRPHPGALRGEVELSHVSFRYAPGEPEVLHNISLHAAPGECVALVGPSGSGKSTLLRLLLGLEIPDSGAIYFDSQDLQNIDVQAVRRQMGVVLQDTRVMPGSIYENIVGTSGRTLAEAWEAARMAGLETDIQEMPMGMHTMIMEGGGAFSGGQRQRLLIARALVNRPRFLLLDEATSALDGETQEAVTQNLQGLRATRLVIAHRLSTIRQADRIYVLEGGKVVQVGTYSELVKKEGAFQDLVRPQLLHSPA